MSFLNISLSPDVIASLELIDLNNMKLSGSELAAGSILETKEGKQVVFLSPVLDHKRMEYEHSVTLKTETESRVESHNVGTVKELSDVLTEGFGLTVLYKKGGSDYCGYKEKDVSPQKKSLAEVCDSCHYCRQLESAEL